ncbi:tubulin nucleotide-binding domain-like protein [Patellaria atrata CBS 101060]|uniref:Tubulin nucleotide-binding domain-like protein n=1 Tax=Patellaria atrata CBS 101060 TaxID=1346257 RepID=A0A9P4VS77_9PEZI|nr:tubulin nucleotide-binding domain-like protein [Patellaria atrata CBS 101060]
MHEIVTLQFGPQSNYLGTHFWNTQDSYFTYANQLESPVNHDIHFQPGIGADGSETFTPRTVIYDIKTSFGSLRRENALYELQEEESSRAGPAREVWNGPTTIQTLPSVPLNAYQAHIDSGLLSPPPTLTTSSVRFWSDYTHLFYHPRSLVPLTLLQPQITSHSSTEPVVDPFETWDAGLDLFKHLNQDEDILDRDLRPFIEEADALQAVQILSQPQDGWGAFASQYVERVRDEVGKVGIWIWGLEFEAAATRETRVQQLANKARSLIEFTTHANVYIPLSSHATSRSPHYLDLNRSSRWHTAALQATALETATLPSHLHSTDDSTRGRLDDLELTFTNNGTRKIGAVSLSVSNASSLEARNPSTNGHTGGPRDPRTRNGVDELLAPHEVTDLDISLLGLEVPTLGRRRRGSSYIFGAAEVFRGAWHSVYQREYDNLGVRERHSTGPTIQRYHSSLLFPQLTSFPRIFDLGRREEQYAVKTSVAASSTVSERIRDLNALVGRIVGVEEREAMGESLGRLAEEYVEGWEGSDGSEDDDI